VRLLFKAVFAVILGVALGLGFTFFALERELGFGALSLGPWTAWPKNGTTEIDPYARAITARNGETPLGSAEGLAFIARTDSDGAPLESRCDYNLTGPMPEARFWTLTLLSPAGFLVENKADRYGFTSADILRRADGAFEIGMAREARAGNWLPIGALDRFILALRLYDSPLASAAATIDPASLPKLSRQGCR